MEVELLAQRREMQRRDLMNPDLCAANPDILNLGDHNEHRQRIRANEIAAMREAQAQLNSENPRLKKRSGSAERTAAAANPHPLGKAMISSPFAALPSARYGRRSEPNKGPEEVDVIERPPSSEAISIAIPQSSSRRQASAPAVRESRGPLPRARRPSMGGDDSSYVPSGIAIGGSETRADRRNAQENYAKELQEQIARRKSQELAAREKERQEDVNQAILRSRVATGLPAGAGRSGPPPDPNFGQPPISVVTYEPRYGGRPPPVTTAWGENDSNPYPRQLSPQLHGRALQPQQQQQQYQPPPQQQNRDIDPAVLLGRPAARDESSGSQSEDHMKKLAKQRQQQEFLAQQMREIEEKKKREKEQKKAAEPVYNPFGRGGAGAPLRDSSGSTITQLRGVKPGEIPPQIQPETSGVNIASYGIDSGLPGLPQLPSAFDAMMGNPYASLGSPGFGGGGGGGGGFGGGASFGAAPPAPPVPAAGTPGGPGGSAVEPTAFLRFRIDTLDPQAREELAVKAQKQAAEKLALQQQMEAAQRHKAEAKAAKLRLEQEEEARLSREREKLRLDYEREESERKKKEQLKEEQRLQAEEARRSKALAAQAEREKDRLADEKAKRQQEEMREKAEREARGETSAPPPPPQQQQQRGIQERPGSAALPPHLRQEARQSQQQQQQQQQQAPPQLPPPHLQQQQQPQFGYAGEPGLMAFSQAGYDPRRGGPPPYLAQGYIGQGPYSPSGRYLGPAMGGPYAPPEGEELATKLKREIIGDLRREFEQHQEILIKDLERQHKENMALRTEKLTAEQQRDELSRELNRVKDGQRRHNIEEFDRLRGEISSDARNSFARMYQPGVGGGGTYPDARELDMQQQALLRIQQSEAAQRNSAGQPPLHGRRRPSVGGNSYANRNLDLDNNGGSSNFNRSMNADSRLVYPDGHTSVLEHIRGAAETPDLDDRTLPTHGRRATSAAGGRPESRGSDAAESMFDKAEMRLRDLENIGSKQADLDPDQIDQLLTNFLKQRKGGGTGGGRRHGGDALDRLDSGRSDANGYSSNRGMENSLRGVTTFLPAS